MQLDPTGRGVDALRAHALRMLGQPIEEWPHIAVMLGDQVYADDSSPATHERIKSRREHEPVEGLPPELVGDFEEYCWLYHESWSPDVERWFFSVVPTAMIFDDHDMIDDWNISDTWVARSVSEPWWERPRRRRSGLVLDLPASREPEPRRDPRRGHAGRARRARRRRRVPARVGAVIRGVHAGAGWLPVLVRPPARRRRARRDRRPQRAGARAGEPLDRRRRRVGVDRATTARPTPDTCSSGRRCQRSCPAASTTCNGGTSASATARGVVSASASASGSGGRSTSRTGRPSGDRSTRSSRCSPSSAAPTGSSPPATISVLSGDIHFSYHSVLHFPAATPVVSCVHQVVNSPHPQRAPTLRAQRDASRDVESGRADRARPATGDRRSAPDARTGTSTTDRCSTTASAC